MRPIASCGMSANNGQEDGGRFREKQSEMCKIVFLFMNDSEQFTYARIYTSL